MWKMREKEKEREKEQEEEEKEWRIWRKGRGSKNRRGEIMEG